jgi:AraC-like DNA-binding protein
MNKSGAVVPITGLAELAVNVRTKYLCPPHFHDTYSISVFHGAVKIWCRGQIWSIDPGQIVVLEPREVHSGTVDSRHCAQDAFFPDPHLLMELFGSEEPSHFPSHIIDDQELAAELSAAAACGANAGLRSALQKLFTRHGVAGQPSAKRHATGSVLGSKITAALGARVVDSSRAAGLSPSHFSRQVRAHLGLSPRDFRRQQRVIAARALIESGEDLSFCALEAGFADQAHMTRQMRSLLGVTPGTLRRRRSA